MLAPGSFSSKLFIQSFLECITTCSICGARRCSADDGVSGIVASCQQF
ncbi:unnamed protein product [Chondrus crispus]|uniref:Uncharacterized protein n=1 Tax=Chondrus crispus TaxID=2769 RepID=R7QB06_CHOCR|nr:unnamed protein product [Chondrus crispus]CDF34591.1 unnamed protein product [Chondrus crispus]|eukprot:XP_005714410.1 unnamed protein product [Chondrus crispus]